MEGDYVYLGDSGTGGTDTDDWTPSASTWTELSTSFTTGAATTSVTIYVNGWYAQPTFYADNLSLTGAAGSGGGGRRDLRARRAHRSGGDRHHVLVGLAVLDRAVGHGDRLLRGGERQPGGAP